MKGTGSEKDGYRLAMHRQHIEEGHHCAKDPRPVGHTCMQPSSQGGHAQVRDIEYDIAGHPKANFQFAVTFPFHRTPERGGGEVRSPHLTAPPRYIEVDTKLP